MYVYVCMFVSFVCVNLYTDICTYVYIHVYTHVYLYVYIYTYICIHTYIQVGVCACVSWRVRSMLLYGWPWKPWA